MDFSIVNSPTVSLTMVAVTVFSLFFAIYTHRKNAINQRLYYHAVARPLFVK